MGLRVDRRETMAVLRGAIKGFQAHDSATLATGVAFRMFLSLFPSLIAAVAIFGLVTSPSDLQDLLANAEGVLPQEVVGILEDTLHSIIESSASGGIAIIAVGGGILAAIGAALTVIKALNAANDVKESRNFFKLRLFGLIITGGLLLALVIVFGLLVVGPVVVDAVLPEMLKQPSVIALIGLGRFLAALAVLTLLFAFILWVGPNRPLPPFHWVTPGAVFGVLGWLLLSYGFSLYVRTLGNYGENSAYGALGAVVVLLLWLQLSFTVLLFGAEIDAVIEQRAAAAESAVDEPIAQLPPLEIDAARPPPPSDLPPAQRDPRPTVAPRSAVGSIVTLGVSAMLAAMALRMIGRREEHARS